MEVRQFVGIVCANSSLFHLSGRKLCFFLSLLLRKEVIHPHLPVRIPCYDFTPITNPTLDGCLRLGCEKWEVRCESF